jgi:hypothetical protein
MFEYEYCHHESRNKPTILEQYDLFVDDYHCIKDLVTVLEPFKAAQKALKGDKYPSLSLMPLVIHQLREMQDKLLAAVDDTAQSELLDLLNEMMDDFVSRWGWKIL